MELFPKHVYLFQAYGAFDTVSIVFRKGLEKVNISILPDHAAAVKGKTKICDSDYPKLMSVR